MDHKNKFALIFSAALFWASMSFGAAQPQSQTAAGTPVAPKTAAQAAPGGDYVGSEICISCHADQQQRFKNTPMGKAFEHPKSADEKLGCESCHGPGKAHVEAGGSKETIAVNFGKGSKNSVAEQDAACITCHAKGSHMFWKGSPHQARGVACVDCHQVKQAPSQTLSSEARYSAPLTETRGLTQTQPELCLKCHQMRKAQLQRSSHMPYREGKVTCSSCHNPHGSPYPKQLLQATTNENCLSCHAERRGPFLFEHPPVMENCATCHDAHGSSNPQLLKVRMPRVCDSCHVTSRHPTTPSTVTSIRNFNRGCTNCHSYIHGSNHPSGDAFLR